MLPLQEHDFEDLYRVAADPAIWEQHPNRDRWQPEVFRNYFDGALQSKGAFKIIDKASGGVAGCTRFYDYDAAAGHILIGYTFYATAYWGTGLNPSVKRLMMEHIFRYVDHVGFHVGSRNLRSQTAVQRLGALKTGEAQVAYHGETPKLNFIYTLDKTTYLQQGKHP